MGSLLHKSRSRFESRVFNLRTGANFRATIQPAPETSVSVDTFAEPRLLMRVRNAEPVMSGDYVRDVVGRMLLVGNHDAHIWNDQQLDRVHKCFQMRESVAWSRSVSTPDPVTGLGRVVGPPQSLGQLWIAREQTGFEQIDRALRLAEDRHRVITAPVIQVGDRLGDQTVRRLISVYGVSLAEIQ